MTDSAPTVTYVSMLTYSPENWISPQQRLEWLAPLFTSKVRLHLFLDQHFQEALAAAPHISALIHPDVTLRPWRLEDSETWQMCRAASAGGAGAPPLGLPGHRFVQKDTEYFMALMHAKAELVATVAAEAGTPFVAFLDAGIHKIFRDPEASWGRLQSLRPRAGWRGVLLPGCWRPTPAPLEGLLDRINWTFCGGFFIVPTESAGPFWSLQTKAFWDILGRRRITWEVNTWVHCLSLPEVAEVPFHWFEADHNDRMTMVPAEWLSAAPGKIEGAVNPGEPVPNQSL